MLLYCLTALLVTACAEDDNDASSPTSVVLEAHAIEHGDTSRRAVALTFDVGSNGSTDPEQSAEILRILREQKTRATFTVTGIWAEQNRDLLFTIAADGHQIINGTYNGTSWTGASTASAPLTSDERKPELSRTEVTVYRYTSRSTRPYFRPPHGDIDASVLHDAAANGYHRIVGWTIDLRSLDAATIAARTAAEASPGAIIALDAGADTATALASVIERLRGGGYASETIAELSAP